jgi:hypothetical protein
MPNTGFSRYTTVIAGLSADRFTRPRRLAHEVLDVLPSHPGFPAYPAKVPLTLHPQHSAQVVTSIGTALSGLGLEAASKPFPNTVQPLAKIVYRFVRKSPETAGIFIGRLLGNVTLAS